MIPAGSTFPDCPKYSVPSTQWELIEDYSSYSADSEFVDVDPPPEQQNIVLIDAATVRQAQQLVAGCEACTEDAEFLFEYILDQMTGSDPSVTDYVLEVPARCLQCGAEINEKTLVAWDGGY